MQSGEARRPSSIDHNAIQRTARAVVTEIGLPAHLECWRDEIEAEAQLAQVEKLARKPEAAPALLRTVAKRRALNAIRDELRRRGATIDRDGQVTQDPREDGAGEAPTLASTRIPQPDAQAIRNEEARERAGNDAQAFREWEQGLSQIDNEPWTGEPERAIGEIGRGWQSEDEKV